MAIPNNTENNTENNTITVQTPWGYSPRNQVTQVNRTPTIYDQSLTQGLSTLVQQNSSISDLSNDAHLGGQEVNRYFKAKNFNANNLEKDTFKRYMNNRNNQKYLGSSQYKYDQTVLNGMLQRANEMDARYDPLTGNKFYYGEKGYDQGVSASDWQTANSQYTTARDDYAKSLIAKEYDNYLQNSLKNTSWKDNSQYGWTGGSKLTQTDVYNLIKHAGDAGSELILNKRLDAYSDNDYKNFKFGDKSKEAFAKALDYYKKNNPALYNAILNSNNYGEFLGNNANYTKIDRLEPTKEGMSKWWEETKNNNQKLVNSIDEQANSTANVKQYLDDQKQAQQRQSTPAKFTSANLTLFKQGGKMNKYQQGGQAPTAAQMVLQALSAAQQGDQSGLQQLFSDKKTAQAVIQQLQKEAQEGSEEAIQALEALKQIMSGSKKQATMAQKGAKLSYIHRLATGCPPGMEMTYFKKGGRLCKACIEKAKKAKEGASLNNIIAKNKERYPGITDDQAAGRAPIRKNGKDYYLGGDGVLSEAPKRSKYGFGGFFEYFKSGGKNPVKRVSKEITDDGYEMKFSDGTSSNYGRNPMNGKSVAIGRDGKTYTGEKADSVLRTDSQKTVPAIKANKKKSMACGGKAKKPKCGTKAKCGAELKKCGGKTPMDKCGGKTTLAKCGAELEKCGGKAKKISSKKPVVNKDKCGGKAKKHAIGGNLELLKYMILNYNK